MRVEIKSDRPIAKKKNRLKWCGYIISTRVTEYQERCFSKTQEGRDQGEDPEPDG